MSLPLRAGQGQSGYGQAAAHSQCAGQACTAWSCVSPGAVAAHENTGCLLRRGTALAGPSAAGSQGPVPRSVLRFPLAAPR